MGCGLSRVGLPSSPTSRKASSFDHNSSKSSSSSYRKENVYRHSGKAPEEGVSGRGVPLAAVSASPAPGPNVDCRRLVLILWDIENVRLPLNTAPGLSPKHIVRYLKKAFIYTPGCTEYRTVCALTERSLARLRRHHPTFIEQVVPDMTVLLASATHAKRNADVSLKKELHQFTHEHAHTARCCPGQLAVVLLSGDEDFLEPLQAALQGGFDVQLVTHDTASGALLAQGYRRPPQLWSSFLRTWSGVQDVVLPYGDEQMHGALRGRAVLVAGLGTGGGGGGRRGGVGGEAVRSAVLQLLRAWPTHEATTGQGGQGEDVVVEELAAAAEVLLVEPQFGAYSGGYCVVVSLPYLHPASFGGEAASAGRQEGEQQGAGRVGGAVDRGLDQLAGYLRRCEACGRHLGAAAGEAGSAAAPAGGAGGGAAAGGAVGGSPGGGGHGGQGRPPPPQQQQLFGWELMRGAAIYEGRRLLQVTIQASDTGLSYAANALVAAVAAPSGASDGGGSATPKSSDTRAQADQGHGRSRSTSRSSVLATAELADGSTVGEADGAEDGVGIGAAGGLRGIHDRMHDATEQLVAVLRAYRPPRLLGPAAGLTSGPGGSGADAAAAGGGGGGGAGPSRPQQLQLQVLCQFSRTPEPGELCRTLLVGSADPWVDLVAAVGHVRGAAVQLAVQHGVELRAELLPPAVCQSVAQGQGQQEAGRGGQPCTGGVGGGGKGASSDVLLQHMPSGAGLQPKGRLPALERPAGVGVQEGAVGPGLGGAGQQRGGGTGGGALEGDGQGGEEEGSGTKGKKKRKKKKNKKGKKGAKRNSVVPLPSGS